MPARLLRWLRGTPTPPAPPAPVAAPPTPRAAPDERPPRLTLRRWLRDAGALPVDAAVELAERICATALLDEGPRRLRNVSSRSLFFTETGGLASFNTVATFDSLPPEEVRGLPADERSDTFIVCLVLFEALRGERVYDGATDLELLTLATEVRLPPLPPHVPTDVSALITRGLARNADLRFPSLEALRVALVGTGRTTTGALGRALEGRIAPLPALPTPPAPRHTEEFLLARIASGDEDARLVYADHLETAGRTVEAAWLREETELRRLEGAAQLASLTRLRALQVPDEFLLSVARAPVEACGVQFGFRCPRTWNALTPGANPRVRWCSACREPVHFATSAEEAFELSGQGRCVAIAPTVQRAPGDVEEAQGGTLGLRVSPRSVTGRRR
jgi:uncharacterized protein (TIGR02996 family)